MDCSKPGLPVLYYFLEFAQVRVLCNGDAIQPSHPLTPSSTSTLNLSQHQGVFQWVSCSYQVTKILELQLQHHSFQWELGLISFKTYWFDLLAVQGTLKSLLQHHSSKASILWCSAFFIVQVTQSYVATHMWSHNHMWEDNSLDYKDLCWLSDVSAFQQIV